MTKTYLIWQGRLSETSSAFHSVMLGILFRHLLLYKSRDLHLIKDLS